MSDILISVKNLYRYYGALCALHDVSFDMRRGEVLGFLGPNGAGKSTTMQIIAGALAPSAGEISIAGYDLFEQPLHAKAAMGYLPEQPPLYRELTVEEYLRFCARLHKLSRPETAAALRRVVAQCGLGAVQHRLIINISKGYQQRVGIAQAILHRPEVVILDEPTVGLDPLQMREIRALIRELGEQHSVILSTHILSEVQAVCNHVQIIRQGKLVLTDTIDGLSQRMHTRSLLVGLEHCPDRSVLQALPGVVQVDMLDAQRVRLVHEDNPTEALLAQAVANRWGLFELSAEKRSLEQVFVELTADVEPTLQEAA